MHKILTLSLLAVCTASVTAQTLVVPIGTSTVEGTSSNSIPWGVGDTGVVTQNFYDAANFTSQGVVAPISITRLRWRPDASVNQAWTAGSYAAVTVRMSTSSVDQLVASPTYANNVGADLTTVFAGALSYPAGSTTGPGPAPYLIDIPLTTAFLYDPNAGDLIVQVELPAGSFTGTAGLQLDMKFDSSCSRVLSYPNYGAPAGSREGSVGVVMEITYAPATGFALSSSYGTGCYEPRVPADFASFYQNFSIAPLFDLHGTALSMLPTANGYDVVPGQAVFVAPSASAAVLPLGNDSATSVTLASPFPFGGGTTQALSVGSNGTVSVAPGNSVLPLGIGNLLNGPQTSWWAWHDYDPSHASGGRVKFEEIGNLSIITWDGVWDSGGQTLASASTFQFQFDRATGAVHLVFAGMSLQFNPLQFPAPYYVGYSPGGPSQDPGSRDISATLPGQFHVRSSDVTPLTLATSARPRLGTTIQMVTNEVPLGSQLGVNVLSFSRWVPGVDLGSAGMPGCLRHVSLDVTRAFLPVGNAGASPFVIPAGTAYAGLEVYSQSFLFVPGVNVLGLLSSNGVRMHLDAN